jgi:hypothetical protein
MKEIEVHFFLYEMPVVRSRDGEVDRASSHPQTSRQTQKS